MQFDILTLFPDIIHSYAGESILGRGQKKGIIKIAAHNFRNWTTDKQKHVDDHPYGGGPGMVLQVQPIFDCLKAIKALPPKSLRYVMPAQAGIQKRRPLDSHRGNDNKMKVVIMDPAGKKFDQKMAEKFSKLDRLVLISGRYEGFDERIYKFVDEKISVGDYVLAGGELPALTIVEAVSRLIPGVLGNAESIKEETHGGKKIQMTNDKSILKSKAQKSTLVIPAKAGIHNSDSDISVEYPQYTRPENFMGMKVPKVLLSGDHKKIEAWRKNKSK